MGPGGRKWASGVSYRVPLFHHASASQGLRPLINQNKPAFGKSISQPPCHRSKSLAGTRLLSLGLQLSAIVNSHQCQRGPPPGLGAVCLPTLPSVTPHDMCHTSHKVPLQSSLSTDFGFPHSAHLNPIQAGTMIERPWRLTSPPSGWDFLVAFLGGEVNTK